MQAISFGDETGDYSSIYNDLSHPQYQSVDSKRFNNKLNIEETYAEIDSEGNVKNFDVLNRQTSNASKNLENLLPEYAMIDLNKKREARSKRSVASDSAELNDFVKDERIYEDVGVDAKVSNSEDKNIYELVSSNYQIYCNNYYLENICLRLNKILFLFEYLRLIFLCGHRENPGVLCGKTGLECISLISLKGLKKVQKTV